MKKRESLAMFPLLTTVESIAEDPFSPFLPYEQTRGLTQDK